MDLVDLLGDKEFCQSIVVLQVLGGYQLSAPSRVNNNNIGYHLRLTKNNRTFLDISGKEMVLSHDAPNASVKEELDRLVEYMRKRGYESTYPEVYRSPKN